MATQSLNELASTLLTSLESEKAAELSKTASASEAPVMVTELGQAMVKVAQVLRDMATADVTVEDIAAFRGRYGI